MLLTSVNFQIGLMFFCPSKCNSQASLGLEELPPPPARQTKTGRNYARLKHNTFRRYSKEISGIKGNEWRTKQVSFKSACVLMCSPPRFAFSQRLRPVWGLETPSLQSLQRSHHFESGRRQRRYCCHFAHLSAKAHLTYRLELRSDRWRSPNLKQLLCCQLVAP